MSDQPYDQAFADAIDGAGREKQVKDQPTEIEASEYVNYATEAEFQSWVVKCGERHGWTIWHDNDSRRNDPGFPDLVCAHPKLGLMFMELKTATGRVRKEQQAWIDLLDNAGVWVLVWRPANQDVIEEVFRDGLGPHAPAGAFLP